MGKFKDILTETRDWAQELRDTPDNNCFERVQYTYQTWNLDQIIKITDVIERACDRLHNKQR